MILNCIFFLNFQNDNLAAVAECHVALGACTITLRAI